MQALFQRIVRQGIGLANRHYLLLCVCLLLISLLVTVLVRHKLLFAMTADLSGVENYNTYWIHRYLAGYALYEDPEKPPFAINAYTPFYFYIVGGLGWLIRLSPNDVEGVYVLGRGVSAIANLFFAGTLFLMGTQIFRIRATLAFLSATLSFLLLHIHCYAIRPDAVYNFLLITSLFAFMHYLIANSQQERYYWLAGSSVAAVLALFTKQSAFFLPFLLGGHLLIFCRRPGWWQDIFVLLVTYTAGFGLCLWAMGGADYPVFFKSVVSGLNNGISLMWLIWFVMPELHLLLPILSVGLVLGVIYLIDRRPVYSFLGWALLAIFVASSGTILKFGSHANYYTEFIGLSLVASMVFWAEYDRRQAKTTTSRLGLLACCGFLCLFQVGRLAEYHYVRFGSAFVSTYQSELAVVKYLRDELSLKADERVFVYTDENTFLNSMLYQHAVLPHNGISILYPKNPYSLRPFREYVNRGGVQYVVAPRSQFIPQISPYESVIPTHLFKHRMTINGYDIFEFRAKSETSANKLPQLTLR